MSPAKVELWKNGKLVAEISEGERKKVPVGTYHVKSYYNDTLVSERDLNIDIGQIILVGFAMEPRHLKGLYDVKNPDRTITYSSSTEVKSPDATLMTISAGWEVA